ncbi:hypothetical protein TFLX_04405 [Thermoflexales bacterium]|nr:hypothetical protein TFLX_04405 [Thermoflexales bacterium]
MVKRAWFAIAFVCCAIVLIVTTPSAGARTDVDATSVAHESVWMSPQIDRLQTTPTERQLTLTSMSSQPAAISPSVPAATFSDPLSDLLFKWLTPDDDDYGLGVNGAALSARLPDGPLGFPSSFYWNTVTFDMYSPSLSLFDRIPYSGDAWFDGSPGSVADPLPDFLIPAFADLQTVGVARSGNETQWQMTSAAALPGLPASRQLGYNINVTSGASQLVQFIGASDFTPTGWRWSIRDRGSLFPGWGNDLDITQVGVSSIANDRVEFFADVAGEVHPTYGTNATWPRYYWYLDSDNSLSTGDTFTFGYQEGSYVFTYRLEGIDAVAEALYDQTTNTWLGMLRKKTGPSQWETVATTVPNFASNRVILDFNRSDAGIYSTFRWGLLTWFEMNRGGMLYSGNVDVAPNAGMQTQTLPVDPDQALAEQYAPILYAADGENYFPVTIDYTLRNSRLKLSNGQFINMPTVSDLISHMTDGSRLDFAGDSPTGTQTIWDASVGRDPTVYTYISRTGSLTAIQYWFHYFYNDWAASKGCYKPGISCQPSLGNNHEGDWEGIQVVLQDDTPIQAVYSQHFDHTRRQWQYVEREGEHPVVYVGWGSHASFFKDAYYSHIIGGAETTGRKPLPPSNISLLRSKEDPAWLQFQGIWGIDDGILGLGGSPTGPAQRDNWADPFTWWINSQWDENFNYGLWCNPLGGQITPERTGNWIMCVSGLPSRFLTPRLRNTSGQVILDPDINTIDPSGRRAEYMLNCENNNRQSIILYKTIGLTAVGSLDFTPGTDRCAGTQAVPDVDSADMVSIGLAIPDFAEGVVRTLIFASAPFTSTTAGQIRFDTDAITLQIDHDNDGTFDQELEPSIELSQTVDFIAPSTINDLSVARDGFFVDLQWTAPGNDAQQGTATRYDVRYAEFPITEVTWGYAHQIPLALSPSASGTVEHLRVESLPPGNYYFAVRTYDQDYNVSGVSNSVTASVRVGVFLPIIVR